MPPQRIILSQSGDDATVSVDDADWTIVHQKAVLKRYRREVIKVDNFSDHL